MSVVFTTCQSDMMTSGWQMMKSRLSNASSKITMRTRTILNADKK